MRIHVRSIILKYYGVIVVIKMKPLNPEFSEVCDLIQSGKSIPVIDFRKTETTELLAKEIGNACREWGFFQIVNHGISEKNIKELWSSTQNFFSLPKGQKRSLNRTSENPWGYFDHELTKTKRDKKEIFDIGPANDPSVLDPLDPFLGVTPWPESHPIFQRTMQDHFETCEILSLKIMAAICVSLGLDKNHLDGCFRPNHTSFLRLNYYPVEDPLSDLENEEREDAGLGVHHHTDSGAVTILCQDDIGGLQVFKDDSWLPIEPIKDALVINIGDMVQVWSNGQYKAAIHRVVAMEQADRYSIPFFFNPSYETVVSPLTNNDVKNLYNDIHWGDFRRRRADGDYANIGKEVQISDYLI